MKLKSMEMHRWPDWIAEAAVSDAINTSISDELYGCSRLHCIDSQQHHIDAKTELFRFFMDGNSVLLMKNLTT